MGRVYQSWINISANFLTVFFFWLGRVPLYTKIDYRKKGTLILTSLLDDLGCEGGGFYIKRLAEVHTPPVLKGVFLHAPALGI